MANKEHLTMLNKGVDHWNQWREKNPAIIPDLSGAKLQGKKLAGANFTGADIRGTDFREADLTDANFTRARAGLGRWTVVWAYIFSLSSGAISGLSAVYPGSFLGAIILTLFNKVGITASSQINFITILFILLLLLILLRAIIQWRFFNTALPVSIVVTMSITMAMVVTVDLQNDDRTLFLVMAMGGAMTVAVGGAMTVTVGGAMTVTVGGAMTVAVGGAMTVAVLVVRGWVDGTVVVPVGGAIAGAVIILSLYIAFRTLKEDEQFAVLRRPGLRFGSIGGTNFQGAVLCRTNFSEALLRGTRFDQDTDLTHTRWHNAKKTELALFFGTIMENRKVRDLLVSPKPDGEGQDFSGLDLRGAYLAYANLKNADFRHTNLSLANLTSADITGAKLHGTSRDGWITENMTCDYVYWDEAGTERGPLKTEYTPDEFEEAVRQFEAGNPDLISRFIEFPPEYHKAGTDILSYFGEILRKKYPDSKAKVRIEQDGLKVKMVIDPGNGEKEVIEKTLKEYGLVITGKMRPEEFTDDRMMLIELRSELRRAHDRIEMQRELLQDKGVQIDRLLSYLGNAIQKEHKTIVIQDKADHRRQIAAGGDIQSVVQADHINHLNQKREENVGDTYNFKAGGDINFAKDQAIATINKTVSESGAPDALKTQLGELTQAVQAMIADMPDHRAKRITDKLAEFSDEVSAPQPDRKWYSVSGEGLIEAAKAVGSLGNPVIKAVKGIMGLLPA